MRKRGLFGPLATFADPQMGAKTCLVTGATSGIGRAAAHALAMTGARVLGVGRNADRCATVESDIRQRTGSDIRFFCTDLTSQTEVCELADKIRTDYRRLDVLIHNAGAMFRDRSVTIDGLEKTFALNHMAPFLLTHLLAGLLEASAPSRIVIVSSNAHRGVTLDFDDLQSIKNYSPLGWKEYQRSKLANLLFTLELSRRLKGSAIAVHAVDPGVVATDFPKKAGLGLLRRLRIRMAAVDVDTGADTVVYLAMSPALLCQSTGENNGRYWANRQAVAPSQEARDTKTARKLWQASSDLVLPKAWFTVPDSSLTQESTKL